MLEVTGQINSGPSGKETSDEPHRHSHTQLIPALFKGRTKGLGGCGAGGSRWHLKREKKGRKSHFSLHGYSKRGSFAGVWDGSVEEGWKVALGKANTGRSAEKGWARPEMRI